MSRMEAITRVGGITKHQCREERAIFWGWGWVAAKLRDGAAKSGMVSLGYEQETSEKNNQAKTIKHPIMERFRHC
jgi:hypothetical protein